MVNFTVEQMRSIMDLKHNIRFVSVIAHVDHGKTTLTDSLVQKAGIISVEAGGGPRCTDTRDDEAQRGINVKSTGVSMFFEYDMKAGKAAIAADVADKLDAEQKKVNISEKSYLINLIDSPSHVDFFSESPSHVDFFSEETAALRVTDGALVVVDTFDGVRVQTETVLRQALSERVKPVLMLNKVDRALLELQLPAEKLYQAFCRSIKSINVIVATYNDNKLGDVQVDPAKGTVAFGSGLHQWAFTLTKFAKTYSAKFNVSEDKMIQKLWGDWYFDAKRSVWTTSDKKGTLERAFCQLIASPIATLFEAIMNEKHGKVKKMLKAIGVELKGEEKEYKSKQLLKRVMQKWLPAGDTVLEMIVLHLPSPVKAQSYRVEGLYGGPLDDQTATAIRTCDTSEGAPMCMYISNMIPTSDKGRFYAFGRVFSGKIATGQKVRIMGPNYFAGFKSEHWVENIQRTLIVMGKYTEQVADVPAGNICALIGVDQYLLKSGTIVTADDAHTIKKSADLPKLVEGMKPLAKSDPMVVYSTGESGGHIIAASRCSCTIQ